MKWQVLPLAVLSSFNDSLEAAAKSVHPTFHSTAAASLSSRHQQRDQQLVSIEKAASERSSSQLPKGTPRVALPVVRAALFNLVIYAQLIEISFILDAL